MVSSMSSIFSFDLWAPWTKVLGKLDPRETIANNVDGRVRDKMTSSWHPLHSALYMWAKGHLPNIVLSCLGDRAEMGHSVEARTPFLDHKFTEYVNAVPPSMKIKYISPTQAEKQGGDTTEGEFQEKYILREAARPFIPDRLYRRKKQQFAAPRTYAPGGPLHQLFSELVTEENVARLGFVDWDSAKDLLQSAFEKHEQMAFRRIVMLAEWVVLSQRFDVPPATAE
ncbi:unnamed protein product [Cercospora beticola]|nr:unnamed protein product [Cercospora beticola]